MRNSAKTCVLAAALVTTVAAMDAKAVVLEHSFSANAVNVCAAFTPGITNTIRNRVVGVENVGPPLAVACSFQSMNNILSSDPKRLVLFFSNTSASGFEINCTLLSSSFDSPGGYIVNKSVAVPAGSISAHSIEFTAADNPTPLATTLGSRLLGVNCTLPTGGFINETRVYWDELI